MAEPPLPKSACFLAAGASVMLVAVGLTAAPTLAVAETPQAREQARLCERLDEEPAIEACRAALSLGLRPPRRAAIREVLALHLVDLERWSELAEHYREDVRVDPEDPEAWFRLGSVLLFALNQKAEALAVLEQGARLDPADASIRSVLAIALHSLGRYEEAAASFDEAVRIDPAVLEGRPAAQAVREAARRGEPWP
jgi:tetratricopeptide (TPR) repeat protein